MNTQSIRNDTAIEVKQNFEYFIELQNNDTGISLDGIGDIANMLFNLKEDDSDSIQLRLALHSRGLRTTSDNDSTEDDITRNIRFTLQRCEIIDKDHIEVKLIRDMHPKTRDEYLNHDILTIKDGKIAMIEPYIQFNNITDETRSDSTDSSSLSSSLLSQWSDR